MDEIVLTYLNEEEDIIIKAPVDNDLILCDLVRILDDHGRVYCLDDENGIVDPQQFR